MTSARSILHAILVKTAAVTPIIKAVRGQLDQLNQWDGRLPPGSSLAPALRAAHSMSQNVAGKWPNDITTPLAKAVEHARVNLDPRYVVQSGVIDGHDHDLSPAERTTAERELSSHLHNKRWGQYKPTAPPVAPVSAAPPAPPVAPPAPPVAPPAPIAPAMSKTGAILARLLKTSAAVAPTVAPPSPVAPAAIKAPVKGPIAPAVKPIVGNQETQTASGAAFANQLGKRRQ